MVKPLLTLLGTLGLGLLGSYAARAQATLSASPYTESFDNLSAGLPAGFGVYTAATSSSLGTSAALTTAATAWSNSTGAFKNFASATGQAAGATTATQAAATNRALGVRQTGSFGDPGASFVFQAANTSGRASFKLTFSLQSLDGTAPTTSPPRTTTWTVDYGLGAAPTSFTTAATGTTTYGSFTSSPVSVDFGSALNNLSGPVTIRISALSASTGSGNRASSAIDDFALSWGAATAPQLTVSPTALALGNAALGSSSAAKTYTLTGANLSSATTLTATGPFSLSKDGSTYASSLSYTVAELASPATVYVRFTPTAAGAATGSIAHSSGTATTTVALSGAGYDPTQTSFSFDSCTGTTDLSDGWSQYSVSGAQTWACTTFGHDNTDASGSKSAPYGVQINGYANGANQNNEDWLISPGLNLSAQTYPTLTFWARSAFAGPSLAVRVSTTYSGSGNPSAATWTTLGAILPAVNSDVWTQVGGLDLSAYKGAKVYVALVYTSSTSTGASRWTIDDVAVRDASAPAAPALAATPTALSYGNQTVGVGTVQSFSLAAANLTGPVTVSTSGADYQVSKDGSTFAASITLAPGELSGPATIQVKATPSAAGVIFNGTVTASTAGASAVSVALSGNTYDLSTSLEVVDWNMEWFGSDPSANLGPTNKDLQQANATKVLTGLRADVYMLEEVVSETRLKQVVTDLSANTGTTYAYSISDFGSAADNPQDQPGYATAQKLVFVYNTAVVSNPSFVGLLRCAKADNCDAYSAWASGRFPYMMTATVTLGGVSKLVRFVNIHAKANATATSASDYQRRQTGANLLKAYLDANYPTDNILIAGDYNDVLNGTIATGVSPAVSSYSAFLNDPADYTAVTLPLANAGAQSTVSYPTVIDNDIASNEMAAYYIPGSVTVRTDLANQIASYGTTTSDHYPVYSRYTFLAPDLVVSQPSQVVGNGIYNSITITSGGAGLFEAPVAVNTTVTVQSGGRLDTNCQPLTGPGSFTVAAGGTLGICDAAGLSSTGSTGAVQVTGTRSFSADASYVYNGTSSQVTGLGLPGQVRALSTTNGSTVTLSQALTVAQTLTVAGSGSLALNGQLLTLRSDASGTALVVNSGTGTVAGSTAAVQRYLDGSRNAGLGYRQLAAPVSGSTVADLSTASFAPVVNAAYNTSATPGAVRPYPTVFGYDESRLGTATNNLSAFDKGWFSPAGLGDALAVGRGYTVNLAAGQVVDFVGTLTNGPYPQNLTRQDQTTSGGWQLLGNPYPSPLDWSLVAPADRSGLDGAVYVSQSTGQYAGQYRSYVNGVGNPVLPVGQGFFARVSQGQASATLTLRNDYRVTSYATPQASVQRGAETRPRLSLTLGGASGVLDGLYVYAEAGATPGFDARQDAAKLPNSTGLNLAALTADGQALSIQALATLAGRVPLRVQVPAAGTYALAAAELLNLPAGTTLELEDAKTGQRTPLTAAGSAYSFAVAATDSPDGRFWLTVNGASPLATVPSTLQAALALYPNPTHERQATLLLPTGLGAGQVQVLDALGRLVRQQVLSAGATTLQLAGLPAGVYVVRVLAGGEQATRRLTLE